MILQSSWKKTTSQNIIYKEKKPIHILRCLNFANRHTQEHCNIKNKGIHIECSCVFLCLFLRIVLFYRACGTGIKHQIIAKTAPTNGCCLFTDLRLLQIRIYQFSFFRLIADIRHMPRPIPATPLIAIVLYANTLPMTVGTDVSVVFLLFELPKAMKWFF